MAATSTIWALARIAFVLAQFDLLQAAPKCSDSIRFYYAVQMTAFALGMGAAVGANAAAGAAATACALSELLWVAVFALQAWKPSAPKCVAARMAPVPPLQVGSATAVPAASPGGRPDFTGVWKQVESDGMDAFLKCVGVGILKRSLAAKAMPKITQVIEHEGDVITVQTKGGLKGDTPPSTVTIGAAQEIENDGRKAVVTPAWEGKGGETIVTPGIPSDQGVLTIIRAMEPGGRMLFSCVSARGTAWERRFERVGED